MDPLERGDFLISGLVIFNTHVPKHLVRDLLRFVVRTKKQQTIKRQVQVNFSSEDCRFRSSHKVGLTYAKMPGSKG
jgi:hypothetical protein